MGVYSNLVINTRRDKVERTMALMEIILLRSQLVAVEPRPAGYNYCSLLYKFIQRVVLLCV